MWFQKVYFLFKNKELRDKVLFILGLFVLVCFSSNSRALADKAYLPKSILIKGSGPEVYVLENNIKHWIPSPEVFESFRYKWSNIY